MFEDIRYHSFHIIHHDLSKWSTEWHRFPGLTYIPMITELEEWILPFGDHLHEFFQNHWHYSVYISMVYIAVILVLQDWMKSRPAPYNLRLPLAYWSSALAVFSIIGAVRTLPEFIHILSNKGFDASFRDSSFYKDWRVNLWYLFFVVSKALELIDTVFIVLRKHKLLTLHWIHHCLTLCYSWFVFGDVPATARWMVNMNFFIHSLMYTYYACKAFRIFIPRAVNVTITSLQIIQMIYGLYINIRVLHLKVSGQPCDCHLSVAVTGVSLYGLFFILFVNFFIRSYVLNTKKTMIFCSSITQPMESRLLVSNTRTILSNNSTVVNKNLINNKKLFEMNNNLKKNLEIHEKIH